MPRFVRAVGAYDTSKFAVVAFAEVLREEDRGRGVRFACVCPPPVATPLLQQAASAPAVASTPRAKSAATATPSGSTPTRAAMPRDSGEAWLSRCIA